MKKNDRKGIRRPRDEIRTYRQPSLEYYLIVTDTRETEENYLNGIKAKIPKELASRLVIKVRRVLTKDLLQEAIEMRSQEAQFRKTWIVFDRDEVINFDEIILGAEAKDIYVGWSNPCIEIWFHAYFGEMPSSISSKACEKAFASAFQKYTKQKYKKNDPAIYKKLVKFGDENRAVQIAKNKHCTYTCRNEKCEKLKPSDMVSSTTIHILVQELSERINNNHETHIQRP